MAGYRSYRSQLTYIVHAGIGKIVDKLDVSALLRGQSVTEK